MNLLQTRRHRLKSPQRISQVCWTKHGQTYLSPADFHKGIDLTVYMDAESNPDPFQSDNTNSWSSNTNTANFSSNHGNIKIAHLNIRSLKNKEHYLLVQELVLKQNFDIFTISETWLDDSVTNTEIEFSGYDLYRLDRVGKRAYVHMSSKV